MKYKNFDLKYEEHLRKLIAYANKTHPHRRWFVNITLWDDTDYKIEVRSSWGVNRYVYGYKKSLNKYFSDVTKGSMEEEYGYLELHL